LTVKIKSLTPWPTNINKVQLLSSDKSSLFTWNSRRKKVWFKKKQLFLFLRRHRPFLSILYYPCSETMTLTVLTL
jgi:hypothetical protein